LVDQPTADALNRELQSRGLLNSQDDAEYLVRGIVSWPDKLPARDLIVIAYDQDLRKRQELGRSPTNASGDYRIRYTSSQFQRAELAGPDLVLEVQTPSGELLHTSGVTFNAPKIANIDLPLAQRGSEAEYDRILRELTPLL